ncbi:hypothetical protein KR054_005847 [Drosophila jambulina]|nr:hypothetical protein KR054_005847 [Drosophila jambulina]
MFDWVSLLLRAGYYYGHIIGVVNFEVDWRTGRVFRTIRSTLHAIASNILIVLLIGLMLVGKATYTVKFLGTHQLYLHVVHFLAILRITAGLTILYNQWRYQDQLMLLVKNSLRLCQDSPQLRTMSRWRILLMLFVAIMPDLFQVAFTLATINQMNLNIFLGLVLQLWISAILNLALANHYLVMLCIRGQYDLLNAELNQIIEESKNLSYSCSRKGAFMTRCCALADQLEDIAKLQDHLQLIVTQLDGIYGVQGLIIFSGYYVTAVATIYTTYSIVKEDLKELRINLRDLIVSFAWSFFFFMAGILNLFMSFHLQDGHKEMLDLLEERTLFATGLDVRLEQSFESFQLQLIRRPLKMDVFKLFPVSRQSTWATVGAILLDSISLIQYDIENF